jgi:hypothetical protein
MLTSQDHAGSRRAACWGAVALAALTPPEVALGQLQLVNAAVDAGVFVSHNPLHDHLMRWVTGGIGVGDFDRDGFPDIYVISGGAGPDWLFMNDGSGGFTNQAATRGLTDVHCGTGAAVGDYDRDGMLDIYATSVGNPAGPDMPGKNRLYRNLGGTFTEVGVAAGVNFASPTSVFVFGAAFGDYNLDGWLDLFVATWQPGQNGNRLYRNDGDGTFTDVTVAAIGVPPLSAMYGFQPAFADMDGDLFPELLIASDFESSRYFVNNRDGTFTNLTVPSGTGIDDNGMGQTVADFNLDGRLDWYVTSIFNDNPPAGNFPGNTLYIATDEHLFTEVGGAAGVKDGGWGWGTVALDLDQDGWEDIVEVNGRETSPAGQWTNEQSYLFRNNGDGTFTEMAQAVGLDHVGSGRAVVYLDADADGDLEVMILTNSASLAYYRNESQGGNWLKVRFDTSTNPLLAPDGFGTRIEATTASHTHVRYMDGKPSFLGTSELIAHFGLGDAEVIDELRVIWSRGHVTTLCDVPVNQTLELQAPALADLDADGIVGVGDLIKVIFAWGPVTDPVLNLVADTNNDGSVDVLDLIAVIVNWD